MSMEYVQAKSEMAEIRRGKPKDVIKNEYLVVMRDNATELDIENSITELETMPSTLNKTFKSYSKALKGFAVRIDSELEKEIRQLPGVLYVQEQTLIYGSDVTWGLDRIDQREKLTDAGVVGYNPPGHGDGVSVYIMDTGIDKNQQEFGKRRHSFYDGVNSKPSPNVCNFHGTHVAGIVGSKTYGVANQAELYSVTVLNCNNAGTLTDIIGGLDYIATHGTKPGVIVMALSGVFVEALNQAIANVEAEGYVVVVAAGNSADDACLYSPGSSEKAITVAATANDDHATTYSNYGECIDIYAPGNYIKTTGSDNKNPPLRSGTSMACPFIAGIAAIHLQKNPDLTPAEVKDIILSSGTKDTVYGTAIDNGSPSLLAYIDPGL
ncbi:aqualysin-1-like [Saccoglossus kowalevskii]